MRRKDAFDFAASAVAAAGDVLAVFGGFLLATWVRFDSGWIPLFHDRPPAHLYFMYGWGAAIATLLFLLLFRSLELYSRPQVGVFSNAIPRLVRATVIGLFLTTALAFAWRTEPPFSRLCVFISLFTIMALLLLERGILFRLELHLARKKGPANRVLILGTGPVSAHLKAALESEPRLRSQVVGFVPTDDSAPDPRVPPGQIQGTLDSLGEVTSRLKADQVVLAETNLGHQRVTEIILLCERNLLTFYLVPDLFHILTARVDIRMVDSVPLLGLSHWPLDVFRNRVLKRVEDIGGALIGLVLTAPFLAVAAFIIKKTSPGPVFYRQVRCGEKGRQFTIYKLRTMRADAEAETGPVWATEDDPRRTAFGAFIRRRNLDELPQLWNVLKGDMSLVGPRPERPHFVEQFKEDISRYMWRHVSKPGMTGWAQVNGLRGNTSVGQRIEYDLYYLENWSMALDFKILVRTFFSTRNAY